MDGVIAVNVRLCVLIKIKNIHVCLVCHKRAEPLVPIELNSNDWLPDKTEQFSVNLGDWIKQEEAELEKMPFIILIPNT